MDKCEIFNYGTVSMHHSESEKPSPSSFEKHCHTTYEVLFVLEGVGHYMYEGERYDITSGTVALVLPCKFHYAEPSVNHAYNRYVLNFSGDDIPSEIAEYLEKYGSAVMRVDGERRRRIEEIFGRLENLCDIETGLRSAMARVLIGEMLITALNNQPPTDAHEDDDLGAMVIKYLNERITSRITLDEIAHDFFVSKSYLCRAFKEYNKISVFGYINNKKVVLARQMIEEGANASVAAYSVGFADYSTFYRAYKRVFGTAPTSRGDMDADEKTEQSADTFTDTAEAN